VPAPAPTRPLLPRSKTARSGLEPAQDCLLSWSRQRARSARTGSSGREIEHQTAAAQTGR
jgi:hypothetical protein